MATTCLQGKDEESPARGEAAHAASSVAVDRRIARSKEALRQALVELMEERGFENITVNDLCARANLTRGTFYNHFHGKDEFIETLEDEVLAGLDRTREAMAAITVKDLVGMRVSSKPFPFLVDMFDYLRENADFLHAVLGPGGDIRFGPRLREVTCESLIKSVLSSRYRENPTPFVEYYVAFYASAYLGVILRWFETGMQESSEEMARISTRLLFIKPGESIELERSVLKRRGE